MPYLIIVSLVWSFSFGIIKNSLAGLDSSFVAFARIAISLIFFLPFFRYKDIDKKFALKLLFTGAIQYGAMYILYIEAFKYLAAYQVAVFTVFTPIYVAFFNDMIAKKPSWRTFAAALVSVAGCLILSYRAGDYSHALYGFILMQISNVCFAFGQIYYRTLTREKKDFHDLPFFALLFLGGFLLTGFWALINGSLTSINITSAQIVSLLYLGAIASGLCFFLWNAGARKLNAGKLAVMNNMKIPLGAGVAVLIFGESPNAAHLAIALTAVFLGLFIAENKKDIREK